MLKKVKKKKPGHPVRAFPDSFIKV